MHALTNQQPACCLLPSLWNTECMHVYSGSVFLSYMWPTSSVLQSVHCLIPILRPLHACRCAQSLYYALQHAFFVSKEASMLSASDFFPEPFCAFARVILTVIDLKYFGLLITYCNTRQVLWPSDLTLQHRTSTGLLITHCNTRQLRKPSEHTLQHQTSTGASSSHAATPGKHLSLLITHCNSRGKYLSQLSRASC